MKDHWTIYSKFISYLNKTAKAFRKLSFLLSRALTSSTLYTPNELYTAHNTQTIVHTAEATSTQHFELCAVTVRWKQLQLVSPSLAAEEMKPAEKSDTVEL